MEICIYACVRSIFADGYACICACEERDRDRERDGESCRNL